MVWVTRDHQEAKDLMVGSPSAQFLVMMSVMPSVVLVNLAHFPLLLETVS